LKFKKIFWSLIVFSWCAISTWSSWCFGPLLVLCLREICKL